VDIFIIFAFRNFLFVLFEDDFLSSEKENQQNESSFKVFNRAKEVK
jgi:hypothetical protein